MYLMVEDVSASTRMLYGVVLTSNFCCAYLIVAQILAGSHGVVLLSYIFSYFFLT